MIAIDGKTIEDFKEDHPFREKYKRGCTLLRKSAKQNTVTFKFVDGRLNKPTYENPNPGQPSGDLFLRTAEYKCKDGEWLVTHYNSFNRVPGTDVKKFLPEFYKFTGRATLDLNKDISLAFWLTFVCPHVETYFEDIEETGIKKLQNLNKSYTFFKLENRMRETMFKVDYEKKITEVMNALFNKGLSDEGLKVVGECFGIFIKDPNEVRILLQKLVLHKKNDEYDIKNITKFLEYANYKVRGAVGSMVQVALNKNLVKNARPPGKTNGWYFMNGENLGKFITATNPTQKATDTLEHYLEANDAARGRFEEILK